MMKRRFVTSWILMTYGQNMLLQRMLLIWLEQLADAYTLPCQPPDVAGLLRMPSMRDFRLLQNMSTLPWIYRRFLYLKKGAPAKCTPPMRKKEDMEKLWDYVLDGTLSCVGSDHSQQQMKKKIMQQKIFGMHGRT